MEDEKKSPGVQAEGSHGKSQLKDLKSAVLLYKKALLHKEKALQLLVDADKVVKKAKQELFEVYQSQHEPLIWSINLDQKECK